jgi:general secretion pathway protein E
VTLSPSPATTSVAGASAADAAVGLDPQTCSPDFLAKVTRDFARTHALLSQGVVGGTERIAATKETSRAALFNVGVRLGRPIEVVHADREAIVRAIDLAYSKRAAPSAAPVSPTDEVALTQGPSLDELLKEADQDLLRTQGKSKVVQLVDALLFDAAVRNASDVHVQPRDDETLIRYRVDGALATVRTIPKSLTAAVVGRIKVMGRMDVAERRVAQDGRATVTIGSRAIDLRIGVFPTQHGERAVLRILDSSRQLVDLEALGMPRSVLVPFLAAANRADGLVLVTGPTGSGKTTTLYSTLSRVASADLNVMTIEDPIEYDFSAQEGEARTVSQSQVNTKKGVTFASGLRNLLRQDPDVILVGEIRDSETARMAIQSSLTGHLVRSIVRQDPDVIMVGEIRDAETAEIAIQAALTGHLVFSTLHTNDAPSAVTRLVDLGVESFLVSASLTAVLAQRLVRRVHSACAGRGCDGCVQTGYLGRLGVFELMEVDEELRSLVARGGDLAELRAAARRKGMRTLKEEGDRLVAQGVTTPLEVERVIEGATE